MLILWPDEMSNGIYWGSLSKLWPEQCSTQTAPLEQKWVLIKSVTEKKVQCIEPGRRRTQGLPSWYNIAFARRRGERWCRSRRSSWSRRRRWSEANLLFQVLKQWSPFHVFPLDPRNICRPFSSDEHSPDPIPPTITSTTTSFLRRTS